jgi:hypothetical protein
MSQPLSISNQPPSPTSYHLRTNERTAHAINVLLQCGAFIITEETDGETKHVGLKCTRRGCAAGWSAEVNKKVRYSSAIEHAFFSHGWNAIDIVNQAHKQTYPPVHMLGEDEQIDADFISPTQQRYRKRARVAGSSTPLRASSSVGLPQDRVAATAVMVASSRLALRWFDRPWVKEWQEAMGVAHTIGRTGATAAVLTEGAKVKESVIRRLAESRAPVTIALDSVTNINQHKIYSMVLHCKRESWFYTLWSIGNATDTGEAAAAQLLATVSHLRQQGLRIVALVTDSASNMVQLRHVQPQPA